MMLGSIKEVFLIKIQEESSIKPDETQNEESAAAEHVRLLSLC